jgi:formylglycine-generating enzyme required for sulfatase activity
MGSEETARTIHLDAFYIDRYEVTIAFYQACMEAVSAPHLTRVSLRPR